jgi:hypothetical protein
MTLTVPCVHKRTEPRAAFFQLHPCHKEKQRARVGHLESASRAALLEYFLAKQRDGSDEVEP